MKVAHLLVLIIASLPLAQHRLKAAEEVTRINLQLPNNTVKDIAQAYGDLANKKIEFANTKLELLLVEVLCDAVLSLPHAIKYIESALFLRGIEITPKGKSIVVFSRFAPLPNPKDDEYAPPDTPE